MWCLTSLKHIKKYVGKEIRSHRDGFHNTCACISLCASCHTSKRLSTHSKWSLRFIEQCCVNADLQLPTKQKKRPERVGRWRWRDIHKWKVTMVINPITVQTVALLHNVHINSGFSWTLWVFFTSHFTSLDFIFMTTEASQFFVNSL